MCIMGFDTVWCVEENTVQQQYWPLVEKKVWGVVVVMVVMVVVESMQYSQQTKMYKEVKMDAPETPTTWYS